MTEWVKYKLPHLDCDVASVEFVYSEGVLGVVISQSGHLVLYGGLGQEAPG